MPIWILIHGILLVIWLSVYLTSYYTKLWTLSTPFSKTTSMKIVFIYFLPFSWLISSIIVGMLFYLFNILENIDFVFLVILPFTVLLFFISYLIVSNKLYIKHRKKSYENLEDFRRRCDEWVAQYPFLNLNNIDLEIYTSKGKPVGRMIISGLDSEKETVLKTSRHNAPVGLTIKFSKKKWILKKMNNNLLLDN